MKTNSDERDQAGRVSDPLCVGCSLASALPLAVDLNSECSWKSALFRNGGSTSVWTGSSTDDTEVVPPLELDHSLLPNRI